MCPEDLWSRRRNPRTGRPERRPTSELNVRVPESRVNLGIRKTRFTRSEDPVPVRGRDGRGCGGQSLNPEPRQTQTDSLSRPRLGTPGVSETGQGSMGNRCCLRRGPDSTLPQDPAGHPMSHPTESRLREKSRTPLFLGRGSRTTGSNPR